MNLPDYWKIVQKKFEVFSILLYFFTGNIFDSGGFSAKNDDMPPWSSWYIYSMVYQETFLNYRSMVKFLVITFLFIYRYIFINQVPFKDALLSRVLFPPPQTLVDTIFR